MFVVGLKLTENHHVTKLNLFRTLNIRHPL